MAKSVGKPFSYFLQMALAEGTTCRCGDSGLPQNGRFYGIVSGFLDVHILAFQRPGETFGTWVEY